jgi:hypothetical protein
MRQRLARVTAVAVVGLFASAANARGYGWDFIVDPDDPSNEVPMTRIGNGYGEAGGQGLFVDDGGVSGVNGFVIGGWTGGFTMDMRVQVLESAGIGRRSFSFREPDGDGRGVALNTGSIQVVSSGVIASYGVDMTDFQIIRMSVNAGTANSYLWSPDPGLWVQLGSFALGSTGASSYIPPAGIGLGSLQPGGTSQPGGRFLVDWVYVDDAQARGQMPPPLPEPATLALLAFGATVVGCRRTRNHCSRQL